MDEIVGYPLTTPFWTRETERTNEILGDLNLVIDETFRREGIEWR